MSQSLQERAEWFAIRPSKVAYPFSVMSPSYTGKNSLAMNPSRSPHRVMTESRCFPYLQFLVQVPQSGLDLGVLVGHLHESAGAGRLIEGCSLKCA